MDDIRSEWGSRLFVASLLLVFSGCVFQHYEHTKKVREDYEACLADHPRDPDFCDELREAARREFDRYEEASKRAWGDSDRTVTP